MYRTRIPHGNARHQLPGPSRRLVSISRSTMHSIPQRNASPSSRSPPLPASTPGRGHVLQLSEKVIIDFIVIFDYNVLYLGSRCQLLQATRRDGGTVARAVWELCRGFQPRHCATVMARDQRTGDTPGWTPEASRRCPGPLLRRRAGLPGEAGLRDEHGSPAGGYTTLSRGGDGHGFSWHVIHTRAEVVHARVSPARRG